MKRTELKRKKPMANNTAKPKPKAKKGMRPDGSPKRGFTTRGKEKLTTLRTTADNLARADCHARGECQLSFWKKIKPPKTTKGACWGGLEWAHIKKRHHHEVRHDPDNCVCLCKGCHTYFTDHEDEFYQAIEAMDKGRHEYLYGEIRRLRNCDYREVYKGWIAFYKNKITERKSA